jgi:hypothetical protein
LLQPLLATSNKKNSQQPFYNIYTVLYSLYYYGGASDICVSTSDDWPWPRPCCKLERG